jgi:rhodanese-related sulfurtransferase
MTADTVAVISAVEAKAKLDGGEAVVVDVRMPYDWAGGRIHGSINLPNLAIQYRSPEIPPEKEVIFYGKNTARGSDAARMALGLGFPNVCVIDGGYDSWLDAGLPTESITGAEPE